jgi:hypothetical protein
MPAYHTSSHSDLMAVDPVEANAFRVVLAEDFEGVTVEDGDDRPVKSAKAGDAKTATAYSPVTNLHIS